MKINGEIPLIDQKKLKFKVFNVYNGKFSPYFAGNTQKSANKRKSSAYFTLSKLH